MSRRDLIDPDVREPLDQLQQAIPGGFNTIPDIVQRRATLSAMLAAMEVPPNPNVTSEDRTVPGPDGAPDITVRIYRPVDATGTLPGIYYIHGGGMILGDIDGEDAIAAAICEHVDAVVVSVEYRLAPEHPYPAPVEDCYAGLVWMAATPPSSVSTRTASPSTAAAREAASPSPPRCWPATAAARRSTSRCRSTR